MYLLGYQMHEEAWVVLLLLFGRALLASRGCLAVMTGAPITTTSAVDVCGGVQSGWCGALGREHGLRHMLRA